MTKKRSVGRPKLPAGEKKVLTSISLNPGAFKAMVKRAKDKKLSRGQFVSHLLEEEQAQYGY